MAPNEPYLRDYICSECHVAILVTHPEEKFALLGYLKCPICGLTKRLTLKDKPHDKIIFGKEDGK